MENRGFPPDPLNKKPLATWMHLYRAVFKGNIKILQKESVNIKSQEWLTKDQALDRKLVDWSRYAITRYM